jgi:raffinose/stachyose/melibiose transport system substrate-binding protein
MTKRILAAILAISLMLAMAACGASAQQPAAPEEAAPASAEPVKLVFATSQAKMKEGYQVMADAIKADENIEIEFQISPDEQYINLIKVKLATSEVPDIFEFNAPTQNTEIGAAQNCVDLSNEPWVARLSSPNFVKDAQDGKIYAQPREASSFFGACYYNVEALKNAGIENPNPKTYQEFLDILQAVKDKTPDVTPIFMSDGENWTTQIFMTLGFPVTLYPNDGDVFGKLLKNEIKWADVPEFKTVLGQFLNLYTAGYANPDHNSAKYDMALEAVATGKAAMLLNGEWSANDMMAKHPETQLGAFVIPWGDKQMMACGQYVQGLFIPSASKNVEQAKRFLNLWSQPKYQDAYYAASPGFSAFSDVNGGDVIPCVKNLVDTYIAKDNYTYQINDQMSILTPIWGDLWNNYVAVAAGSQTADEALADWQIKYEDFMKQQQQPGF